MRPDIGLQSQFTEEVRLPPQPKTPAIPQTVTGGQVLTSKPEPGKTTLAIGQAERLPASQRSQFLQKSGLSLNDPWLTYSGVTNATQAQREAAKKSLQIGQPLQQKKPDKLSAPAKLSLTIPSTKPSGIAGPPSPFKTTQAATTTNPSVYNAPKKGDAFPNGTFVKFGGGLNMGRKEQKGAAVRPGAGVWALGFDPRDPNFESNVTAWLAKHKNASGVYVDDKGRPINWMNGEHKGNWGKQNVPSFKKLKEMYPDKSDGVLLDAAFRGAFSESSIPATNFLEQMIDPLVEVFLHTVGNMIAPGAGTAAAIGYGGIKGGVEGGLPGGLLGSLGGYSAAANPLTNLAISAAGAINPDLGTALGLATGGYKGLTGQGWKDFAGTAAGKAAGAVTDNPYIRFMAGLAGRGLSPGPTKGS